MISTATDTETSITSNEFLTFHLGDEGFCLGILNVQEIRGYDEITTIANTPDYVKGVINLRGNIVPIFDLRIKFKFEKVEYDALTVVIILNLNGHDLGIVVDAVSDVIALKDEQISNLPNLVSSIDTAFIKGIATVETEMLIMLDVEKLISKSDLALGGLSTVH